MGEGVDGRRLRVAGDDEARAGVRLQVGRDGRGEGIVGRCRGVTAAAAPDANAAANVSASAFVPEPIAPTPTPLATDAAKASIAAGESGRRWSARAPVSVGVDSTT